MQESVNFAKCELCSYPIKKEMAGRRFSRDELEQLLSTGQTDKLNGFISKTKSKFSAVVRLDKENDMKPVFDFSNNGGIATIGIACPACSKKLLMKSEGNVRKLVCSDLNNCSYSRILNK